ncbi:MAG: DNA/RNA non-specific endonuclease [Catonella sp.]|nr:DNA/RNA non-specific endonuclease [Catonella sp.]MDY6356862.1 DNA/RNA non-specific endonuclease [Catonella sp.]
MNKFRKILAHALVTLFVITSAITPLPGIQSCSQTIAEASTGDYIEGKASTLVNFKWDGRAVVNVNNNKPQFKKSYKTYKKTYFHAAGLDKYDRPHTVRAVLGSETVNNGYRESIGQFKPAGWQTVKYPDIIDGLYVFNRCHLVGQAISAGKYSSTVNSKLNLVTGTRYMNVDGMEPYENEILSYLKSGRGHILYQVTPLYKNEELVCRGVWMQAYSMEDKGKAISFNIYCPDVQPGIKIDYSNGDTEVKNNAVDEMNLALKYGATSVKDDGSGNDSKSYENTSKSVNTPAVSSSSEKHEYVVTLTTKKFHLPTCRYVKNIKPANKKEGTYNRNDLINEGYVPCKVCNP